MLRAIFLISIGLVIMAFMYGNSSIGFGFGFVILIIGVLVYLARANNQNPES